MATTSLPTSMVPVAGYKKITRIASEAIDAGEVVYLTSGQAALALGDATATAEAVGIAMNSAAANQPVDIMTDGDFTGASGLTAGDILVLDVTTAGDVMDAADLMTGDIVTIVCVAVSATRIRLALNATGIAVG